MTNKQAAALNEMTNDVISRHWLLIMRYRRRWHVSQSGPETLHFRRSNRVLIRPCILMLWTGSVLCDLLPLGRSSYFQGCSSKSQSGTDTVTRVITGAILTPLGRVRWLSFLVQPSRETVPYNVMSHASPSGPTKEAIETVCLMYLGVNSECEKYHNPLLSISIRLSTIHREVPRYMGIVTRFCVFC